MDRFIEHGIRYPHVHLSFDDHSVAAWYTARGVLMSRKAKAVFYVDSWDELDDEDIDMLRALRSDGHVIGCHGVNHVDALPYSQKYGIDSYIEEEVIPAMESMASLGFSPTHFAFPNSSYDQTLYEAVCRLFCHVRPKNEDSDRLLVVPRVRSGDMVGVVRDITNYLKSGHGIRIVLHDIRRIGSPKSIGTNASENGFLTANELDTILATINETGASYETFADHCKDGKDSFDKPDELM